jgi:predicted PolB exonuclease-like 3'-5' exonuclease
MTVINANVDDKLVLKFRHVIYERHGLKKGDFKNALEEAMLDYIQKYSESGSDIDRLAETAKSMRQASVEDLYAELAALGVNVKEISDLSPTADQLNSLLEGLKKIKK